MTQAAQTSPGTSSTDSTRPVVAVIGAAGGIGSALCRKLSAEHGVDLLLGGRNLEALEGLAQEIGGTPIQVDARDFEQVVSFLGKVPTGSLTGVVNLAGSILLKPAHATSEAAYRDTVDTNLTTAFATVRAAGKTMRKGGSVVLVTSAVADIGLPNHEAIAAAKGGVAALARSAAATYASRGLRVNAVAPGLVKTPMTRSIVENDMALSASLGLHPLGRAGEPEEVASLIAWLLGPDAGWVSGQVWGIDGGLGRLKGKPRI